MKVILKSVSGQQREASVEPTTTVLDLKNTLEDEYDKATLRLCFKGAILNDAQTMTEAGIAENDQLVIAGKKRSIPKPAAPSPIVTPPPPPETPSAPAAAPAANATAPVPASAPAPVATPVVQPAAAPAPAPAAPAAAAVDHTQLVDASLIDNLVAMGFEDRTQVALALRAAYMNLDRAVEYLCTGIPPYLIRELNLVAPAPAPTPATATGSAPVVAPAVAPPDTVATTLRSLLWSIPHFEEIRAVAQESAASMPVVMQQIAERHPRVYEQIEANPEEFLTIMAETGGQPSMASPDQAAASGSGDLMSQMPAELHLTGEDRVAVQQLVELGGGLWDEQGALLVYLATQRNQEMAASVLFEHGGVPQELLAQILQQMGNVEGAVMEEDDDEEHHYEDED